MIVADAELLLFAVLQHGDAYGCRAALADVAHFLGHLRSCMSAASSLLREASLRASGYFASEKCITVLPPMDNGRVTICSDSLTRWAELLVVCIAVFDSSLILHDALTMPKELPMPRSSKPEM